MNTTTRIHTTDHADFAEFHAGLGHRRPVAAPGRVEVVVIGHTGQVGSALVARLAQPSKYLDLPAPVFREGLNRTSHLVLDGEKTLESSRDDDTLGKLGARLQHRGHSTVIVDCTADPDLPRHYPEWLEAGIGVVTPNKHGFSGDLARYHAIKQAARSGQAPLGYSATVGAGLPILSALRRLRHAGSTPTEFTAVVSGTLAHVFSCMTAATPLSTAVADARSRGFTEPDPLEDLSGRDVARKLAIMLREAGLDEIPITREPVVDDDWAEQARGRDDVIRALESRDRLWRRRFEVARSRGETWVYLAHFGPGGARVGPARVDQNSPLAALSGSGNLARIRLTDDPDTPVEIHGPGAGVAVTASAVAADLIDAAQKVT